MRTIFVTGIDTNVGKTVVTGLMAAHLAKSGANFRAIKPFCSGDRADAVLLRDLQEGKLPLDSLNPFYFDEPLSPWTAARRKGHAIGLEEALSHLCGQAAACDLLLIEGAGGLLSPLGDRFTAADLIVQLRAEVIVVAADRLGVLNHALLTLEALTRRDVRGIRVALVAVGSEQRASETNEQDLRALLPATPILRIPFFPGYGPEPQFFRGAAEELRELLEQLVEND